MAALKAEIVRLGGNPLADSLPESRSRAPESGDGWAPDEIGEEEIIMLQDGSDQLALGDEYEADLTGMASLYLLKASENASQYNHWVVCGLQQQNKGRLTLQGRPVMLSVGLVHASCKLCDMRFSSRSLFNLARSGCCPHMLDFLPVLAGFADASALPPMYFYASLWCGP